MSAKKKVFWIAALIIVAAIIIAVCVSYFTSNQGTEFDGTLVKTSVDFSHQL